MSWDFDRDGTCRPQLRRKRQLSSLSESSALRQADWLLSLSSQGLDNDSDAGRDTGADSDKVDESVHGSGKLMPTDVGAMTAASFYVDDDFTPPQTTSHSGALCITSPCGMRKGSKSNEQ